MTSYQKLKKQNEELSVLVGKLVMEPNSKEMLVFKMKYRIRIETEKDMWRGRTNYSK